MTNIGLKVVTWYKENGRDMSWRESRDPYKIWIAEVIFQQTRITQGLDYYYRFIGRFPDVFQLASAPLDEVLKYWEGLGYYSRARNLHASANIIVDQLQGKFPQTHTELIKLKGIGPYTARAISSFAFDEPVGVLDGNVLRVVSRLTGDFSPVNLSTYRKTYQVQIDTWAKQIDSRAFNHGMMDIGATICTPTKPGCLICPLLSDCTAYQEGLVHLLPQKKKLLNRKIRYYQFYLATDKNSDSRFIIRQRPAEGLWGGLWEIPNEEVAAEVWKQPTAPYGGIFLGRMKHVFTHFDMMIKVCHIKAENYHIETHYKFITIDKISNFAFSKAVLKILDEYMKVS